MTRTGTARKAAASVVAGCIGLLLLGAPVAAQTYSNNQDNTTNQPEDDNSGGSDGSTGGSDAGNDGSNSVNDGNDNGGTTPGTETTPDGNSGTPTDGTPVGQVDEDLAFTGADARSLALIGAGAAGAGALLIAATRRREAEVV